MSRPTELAITLAALPTWWEPEHSWVSADAVAHRLRGLGFDVTAQQTGAWLARMARTDAPWVARRRSPWGSWEYEVTRFGLNDIDNRLTGVRVSRRPTAESRALASYRSKPAPGETK